MSTSFFSVGWPLIVTGLPMKYDLFVNASGRSDKEKFVRVFPIGEILTDEDKATFKSKYPQLYIPETQRSYYLQSLTKSDSVDDVTKTNVIKDSAIKYLGNLFDEDREFTTEVLNETIDGCKDTVENMVEVMKDYNITGLRELVGNLSFHDFYTYDHSINVSMYNISIMKLVKPDATNEDLVNAGLGGMLHDLGKQRIPNTIINHPGKLTDEMFAEIKKHPGYGKELLEDEGVQAEEGVDLNIITRVVYEHHENYDGTGYPNKLAGEDIHLFARITAISDFFDAITTKRSYHEVMPIEDALHVMSRTRGKKIDPKIFDLFVQSTKILIKEGKLKAELPDDYDPCQPQDELPLQEIKKAAEKDKNFGKIRIADRMKPKKKNAA